MKKIDNVFILFVPLTEVYQMVSLNSLQTLNRQLHILHQKSEVVHFAVRNCFPSEVRFNFAEEALRRKREQALGIERTQVNSGNIYNSAFLGSDSDLGSMNRTDIDTFLRIDELSWKILAKMGRLARLIVDTNCFGCHCLRLESGILLIVLSFFFGLGGHRWTIWKTCISFL